MAAVVILRVFVAYHTDSYKATWGSRAALRAYSVAFLRGRFATVPVVILHGSSHR